ncbi:unnamed protein product [Ixodes hexagonus]
MPPSYKRYRVLTESKADNGSYVSLLLMSAPRIPDESLFVSVEVIKHSYDTVRIRIFDSSKELYEPPVPQIEKTRSVDMVGYKVMLKFDGILQVTNKRTNRIVFKADLTRLIFAEKLVQLPVKLPSSFVYGLRSRFLHSHLNITGWTNHVFYTKGIAEKTGSVSYEGHPLLIPTRRTANSASGIFLLNSNKIEVLISPNATATFKTSGGILDFFVFMGPKPQSVVAQYQRLVGFPCLPSAEMLRDHGSDDATDAPESLSELITNSELAHAVNNLALRRKAEKQNITVTPKIVIHDGNGAPYVCYHEDKSFYNIDFTHPLGRIYWAEVLYVIQQTRDLTSSGLLLLEKPRCSRRDNKSVPCPSDTEVGTWQDEPSQSDDLCGSARLHLSSYRNLKLAYPYLLAQMTHRSLLASTQSRPLLLSEATFSGQGKWSGYWDRRPMPTWLGLRKAFGDMLLHNMYGIPVFGTNMCGHLSPGKASSRELCNRWTALGVFFPVFQNAPTQSKRKAHLNLLGSSKAVKLRQFLQPYMYTLLYKSSLKGDMVAKPTSFEFPDDPKTYDASAQFMFGPSLLVVPHVTSNLTLLSAYFPRGVWYDWYNSKRINSVGQTIFVPSPNFTTGLFARGGSVIPGERPKNNTTKSTKRIHLVISQDSSNYAYGELYRDDGGSPDNVERGQYGLFHFFFMKNVLTGHCSVCKFGATLGAATVFGVTQQPSAVTINGRAVNFIASKTVGFLWRLPFLTGEFACLTWHFTQARTKH